MGQQQSTVTTTTPYLRCPFSLRRKHTQESTQSAQVSSSHSGIFCYVSCLLSEVKEREKFYKILDSNLLLQKSYCNNSLPAGSFIPLPLVHQSRVIESACLGRVAGELILNPPNDRPSSPPPSHHISIFQQPRAHEKGGKDP